MRKCRTPAADGMSFRECLSDDGDIFSTAMSLFVRKFPPGDLTPGRMFHPMRAFVGVMATLRYEPCPQFINVSQRALHICWQFSAMSHAIHKIVSKNAANLMINFLFSFVVSPHTFWHRPPGPYRPWNEAYYGSVRNIPWLQ